MKMRLNNFQRKRQGLLGQTINLLAQIPLPIKIKRVKLNMILENK